MVAVPPLAVESETEFVIVILPLESILPVLIIILFDPLIVKIPLTVRVVPSPILSVYCPAV